MRTASDHIVTTADARLTIVRRDEAGHGGAHHEYEVLLVDDTGRAMRTAGRRGAEPAVSDAPKKSRTRRY